MPRLTVLSALRAVLRVGGCVGGGARSVCDDHEALSTVFDAFGIEKCGL